MNVNKISEHLWLGNYEAAKDSSFFQTHNIKFVVNCTRDLPYPEFYKELGIKAIRLPINDIDTSDNNAVLINNMDSLLEQINSQIQSKHNVLVHCFAGVSRSATTVACYLIKYYNFRYDLAIFFIQWKRPVAFRPTPMFRRFLMQFAQTTPR